MLICIKMLFLYQNSKYKAKVGGVHFAIFYLNIERLDYWGSYLTFFP